MNTHEQRMYDKLLDFARLGMDRCNKLKYENEELKKRIADLEQDNAVKTSMLSVLQKTQQMQQDKHKTLENVCNKLDILNTLINKLKIYDNINNMLVDQQNINAELFKHIQSKISGLYQEIEQILKRLDRVEEIVQHLDSKTNTRMQNGSYTKIDRGTFIKEYALNNSTKYLAYVFDVSEQTIRNYKRMYLK